MINKTITDYYGEDHDRLDGLFAQYQALKRKDSTKAEQSFRQFKAGLERHIRWEEEILFPAFEEKTGMRQMGPTVVMRQEHQEIRRLLGRIAERLGQETDADESSLLAVLGEHNRKEENVLYPAIDHHLSAEERGETYSRMDRVPLEAGSTPPLNR